MSRPIDDSAKRPHGEGRTALLSTATAGHVSPKPCPLLRCARARVDAYPSLDFIIACVPMKHIPPTLSFFGITHRSNSGCSSSYTPNKLSNCTVADARAPCGCWLAVRMQILRAETGSTMHDAINEETPTASRPCRNASSCNIACRHICHIHDVYRSLALARQILETGTVFNKTGRQRSYHAVVQVLCQILPRQ